MDCYYIQNGVWNDSFCLELLMCYNKDAWSVTAFKFSREVLCRCVPVLLIVRKLLENHIFFVIGKTPIELNNVCASIKIKTSTFRFKCC